MEINIRGDLVDNDSADLLRWWGWLDICCPMDVSRALADANGEEVTLLVNSPGGDMTVGTEIYSLLRRYSGRTVALVQGFAASAATLLLQGATVRQAEPGALICVHNPSLVAEGAYRELQGASDSARNAREAILDIYAQRSGAERSALGSLMNRDIWISAGQAVEYGLLDEVLAWDGPEDEPLPIMAAAATAMPRITNKMRAAYQEHLLAEKKKTLAQLRQRQLELM